MNPIQIADAEKRIRESATSQISPQHRNNYLDSCIAHGGEIAEIATRIKTEMDASIIYKPAIGIL